MQRRKRHPCYKVAKNMAWLCLCSSVLGKVQLFRGETEYLTGEISKKSFESLAWLLRTAHSKMWEERNDLKMELLIRREVELKDSEHSHFIHIEKNDSKCSRENIKVVAKQPSEKEIIGHLNRSKYLWSKTIEDWPIKKFKIHWSCPSITGPKCKSPSGWRATAENPH